MPIFVEKRSDEEVQRRWGLACAAQKAELKRSYRDPRVWCEQFMSLVGATIKAFCLFCVFEMVFRSGGAPPVTQGVSMVFVYGIVGINPRGMFWRVVFRDRARAAFSAVIDELNERDC